MAEANNNDLYNKDVFTIDLSKAKDKVQQQLGDRIEGEENELPITDIIDYEVGMDNLGYDEEFDDEMIDEEEEYIDDEEEKAQRLQYFRERRFSVFPIA